VRRRPYSSGELRVASLFATRFFTIGLGHAMKVPPQAPHRPAWNPSTENAAIRTCFPLGVRKDGISIFPTFNKIKLNLYKQSLAINAKMRSTGTEDAFIFS
jgi:hypothetical protein